MTHISQPDNRELLPTRESLLERLRLWGDDEGWQQFFEIYWKLLYRTARAAGLSHTESDDCVQETIISVAKHMPTFRYRPATEGGAFKRWLLKLTKWRISDQFRRRLQEDLAVMPFAESPEYVELGNIPDPLSAHLDEMWEAEWELNLLDAALERLKHTADPKHFQIFHLNVVKQWTPFKIARHLRVSIPQVYTVKHRLARELSAHLTALRRMHED